MPDQSGVTRPIAATELDAAWRKEMVLCVDETGVSQGSQIPIVEGAIASFFDIAAISLPTATSDWVGGKPLVGILWDPNACGNWEQESGDRDWVTAGLFVRGAALDSKGRLVLSPDTTTADINLVDITEAGKWQDEVARPDDSDLPTTYPQLVNPVQRAKQIVTELAVGAR